MKESIKQEIKNIIKTPTVLRCKDGRPIEYKNSHKYRKIKVRNVNNISIRLMMFIAENGGDISSIQKFSSGDFASFLLLSRIYS